MTSDSTHNFDELPEDSPSLCIPRALKVPNTEDLRALLANVFGEESLANIVIRTREDSSLPSVKYYKIVVHFRSWPRGTRFDDLRRRVLDGGSIKIVYEYPRYWRCFMNRNTKRTCKPKLKWLGGVVS